MLMAKVPAVLAAVLFMSSVSAQAMEFADRPGIVVIQLIASNSGCFGRGFGAPADTSAQIPLGNRREDDGHRKLNPRDVG